MKKFVSAFLIFLFFLFINQTVFAITVKDKDESGYISLNAVKEKEVEPNFVTITFSVENTGVNAILATEENNKLTNKIISELKLITNQANDIIKTTSFNVRPVYTTKKDGTRIISNYIAVNSISVQFNNLKNVPNIIDKAILNGANRVSGLNYSYKDDDSVCKNLYPLVIKELKEQADLIAQSAGTAVSGIKHINASCNTENSIQSARLYAKSNMDSATGSESMNLSTPIEFGKVKVRVYVNTDFYVK